MPQGQVEPAMAPQAQGGKEARGKIVAGLGLEMVRMAIAMFPKESDMAIALAETAAKLGKHFKKPEEDMGAAELKFMGSQLYPHPRPMAMDAGSQVQSSLQSQGVGASAPGAAPPQGGM